MRLPLCLACLATPLAWATPLPQPSTGAGLFPYRADIGAPAHAGTLAYEEASGTYLLGGGGTNMWFNRDDFHFAWTEIEGDFRLIADVAWPKPGGDPHRKACLLVRAGLETDAVYADAALHGDGLTSLQFREEQGGPTHEVQANVRQPKALRLERCGNTVTMAWSTNGTDFLPGGGAVRLPLPRPALLGLGVCAHNNQAFEQAAFSHVRLERLPHQESAKPVVHSTLEVIDIASKDRRAIYTAPEHFEAPNWSRDGQHFLINRQGRICRIPATGGEPVVIDTGFANRCNNDHGLSPDGSQLAISDQSETGKSMIYLVPAAGGTPRKITPSAPSYWHGWSPDGRTLVYCAERKGEFDIYAIAVEGGTERRLTTAPGLDDGPEFSPDGTWIYFNSERSGSMKVWRMRADGSGQEQVTRGDYHDWFPHPSPDGKWIAFLSYAAGVKGHPANEDVLLRAVPAEGGEPVVLARVFGGQGTLNVPSWAPDSRKLAFVSYRLVHH